MKTKHEQAQHKKEIEQCIQLLQAAMCDPLTYKKISDILLKNKRERCLLLDSWLEQLLRQKAPEKLRQLLTLLYDEKIVRKVVSILGKKKYKNSTDQFKGGIT